MARDGIVSFLERRRWLRDEPERRLPRVLRWLSVRTLLVLVPLIGFQWADSARVSPVLTEINTARARESRQLKSQNGELLAAVSQLRLERQYIRAALDTLHLPAIAYRQALCDSLREIKENQARCPAVTQAQVDSLDAVRNQLVSQMADLQGEYWTRVSTLNNLDAWQDALRDSMLCSEQPVLAPTPPKRGITVRSVVTHVGYVLAPMLGYLWAHDS